MKVLVTGGAGFIGSAIIQYVLEYTDFEVVNVDKLSYAGNLESLRDAEKNPNYCFEEVDICDQATLNKIFVDHGPSCVMHLAAESHVDRSIDGPADFIDTNVVGTFKLLEAARLYFEDLDKPEKKRFRFHHISTDEVYGDLEGVDDLFTEETAYDPSSPYSASRQPQII